MACSNSWPTRPTGFSATNGPKPVLAREHLETIVLDTPAHHLLSIRGLSPLWVAYYLDLVGYPPHFDWADQVWAFVGFDTVVNQSGDSNPNKPFHISRRGDPFHRHVLAWMGILVAGHHPTFGQVCIAAEERGIGLWGAVLHTAHKLHRTCFRLLLDDRPYYDDTHPDDFARWRAYWLAYRPWPGQAASPPAPETPPSRPLAAYSLAITPRRSSPMADQVCTQGSLWPYPQGPVGAHRLPTGPRGVGRLTLCATPIRRDRRCSTCLERHGPRGPPPPPDPTGSAVSLPALWKPGSPQRQQNGFAPRPRHQLSPSPMGLKALPYGAEAPSGA